MANKIKICNDFNRCPGLRTYDISMELSGEVFYHSMLNQKFYEAMSQNQRLVVDLDGTAGYTPSFIDESFGRLVFDFGCEMVVAWLDIVSDEEPFWKELIFGSTLNKWEDRRIKSLQPMITAGYNPPMWWHRNADGTLTQISNYNESK